MDLFLIPGLMCDHSVWQPLLPALSPLAQCHIVDHGDADDLGEMARRVLVQAPERFAVAGHSMGGRVVLEILRQAPQRVSHVGLLDTGFKPLPEGVAAEEERRKRQALLDIARQQGVRAMAREWVKGMVAPHRLGDTVLLGEILDMFERKSADTFARQIRALLARPDGTSVLQRIDVPTLVLCGEQDSWSPPAQHQAMADVMPLHPPVRVVPGAGHMVTMEQPQAVAQAVCDWLREPSRVA